MNFYKAKSLVRPPVEKSSSEVLSTLFSLKEHLYRTVLFNHKTQGEFFADSLNIYYSITLWVTLSIWIFYLLASSYKREHPNEPGGVNCLAESSLIFFGIICCFYLYVIGHMTCGYYYHGESIMNTEQQLGWIVLLIVQYLVVACPFLTAMVLLNNGSGIKIVHEMICGTFLIVPCFIIFIFFLIFNALGLTTLLTILFLSTYTILFLCYTCMFQLS